MFDSHFQSMKSSLHEHDDDEFTLALKWLTYIKYFVSVWYIEIHLCFDQFTTITTQSTNAESIACGEYSLQSSGEVYILKWKFLTSITDYHKINVCISELHWF